VEELGLHNQLGTFLRFINVNLFNFGLLTFLASLIVLAIMYYSIKEIKM